MAPVNRLQHSVNKWASRVIPAVLVGLVGFATWVLVALIAVNYCLFPPEGLQRRRGAGIAIIVIYFILFLLMSAAYSRVLQVVLTNPGLVPLPHNEQQRRRKTRGRRSLSGSQDETYDDIADKSAEAPSTRYLDRGAIYGGRQSAPNGLEQYYMRDVFECEIDGLPRWCSNCRIWKPDRSHHGSEIGRCVYKMDHYCPWAGGIISETSYKFFLQFCIYALFYCAFNLIVTAYFTAEWHRLTGLFHVSWVIVVALCGLFTLFTLGMSVNSLQACLHNTTTVDSLTRQNRVYYFAVLMPDWHPLVQHEIHRRSLLDQVAASRLSPPSEAATPYATITYPLLDPATQPPLGGLQKPRVFAILPSPQGSNPYLLRSIFANFKAVFGGKWYDFLVPVRYSPCCNHLYPGSSTGDPEKTSAVGGSMYELGPVLEDMIRDAGLSPRGGRSVETDRHGRRRLSERRFSTQQPTPQVSV